MWGQRRGMHFAGCIAPESELFQRIDAQCRLLVQLAVVNSQGQALFIEQHAPVCDAEGNFAFVVGQGTAVQGRLEEIDWSQAPLQARVAFATTAEPNRWVEAGSSPFGALPVAYHAEQTGRDMSLMATDSALAVDSHYVLANQGDTLVHLNHQGHMGILGPQNQLQANLATGKAMHFSTDRADGNLHGAISFHWTILESKPAIVGYDMHGGRHFAIVAHYWSHSGRAHQHISIEVDDKSGEAQTRIAFPYGQDTVDVKLHGHLYVYAGDFRHGSAEHAPTAFHTGDAFNTHSLTITDKDALAVASTHDVQILSAQDTASLKLYSETKNAAIALQNTTSHRWKVANNKNLKFLHNDSDVLSLSRGGYTTVGPTVGSHGLRVQGGMRTTAVHNARTVARTEITTSHTFKNNDLVGIHPDTGEYVPLAPGTPLVGIVNASGDATDDGLRRYYVATIGRVKPRPTDYYVKEGRAYSLVGDYLIGIVLTDNYVFINRLRE